MQIKELKSKGLEHEFEITIPANDIDAHLDEKLMEYGKTMKMPGFRPGKVPMKILKQKYGKAVLGEVLEKAVNESSMKALSDKKLKPAMQPKIEVKSKDFGEGNDLIYSMAVEVLPELKIVEFKGQSFERPVAKPDDKAVDDALTRIASSNTTTKKIETDRGAKDGDTLLMDFDGRTADDNVHHEGMKAEGHRLKLGSGQFIPGFEEQLLKAKAGDKVEVKVSFPDQYGAKELEGRDAIFDVTVHEIHEDAKAEINDEFAKTLGMDDLKALKEAVTDQLQKEMDQQSRVVLKKDILDFLDEKHKFEIPPGMHDMEYQNIADQVKIEKQRQGEDNPELDKAEEKEYREIADRRVRLGLVLSEIGNTNNLTISDTELQRAVITEAQKYRGQEKEVFDYYSKNQQALESLRAPLYEEKVVDFIVELCDIKDKEIKADDLFAMLNEDGDEAEAKPKKKTASKAKKADGEKKPPAKKKAAAKK